MKQRITAFVLALLCILPLMLPLAAEDTAAAESTAEETTAEPAPETTAEPEPEAPEMILDPGIENVGAACVYNIENDRYIYELDADRVIYPASTVKLMTAIVAIELMGSDMQRKIEVPAEAIFRLKGNNIALKRGEVLTLEQLLYALICGGANDAANTLAIEAAGSIEAFVALMNDKAQSIGAVNTNYTNPTGMHDPAMVTTARDTAIIATYALGTVPIADMSSVEKFVLPATNKAESRTVFNKNYYFATNMEYLYIWKIPRGLNAGYTIEGGYCVATTATRDGLTYVVVVMDAKADEKYIYSYTEAADLIKWAFNTYGYVNVLTTADMICEVPVRLASRVDYVTLFPSQNIELYLPTAIDVSKDIELDWHLTEDSLTAPVSEGQVVGSLTVTFNGTDLGTYDLITRNSVSRNNVLYVLDLFLSFTESGVFRAAVVILILAAAAYVGVLIFIRTRNNRRRTVSRQIAPQNRQRRR